MGSADLNRVVDFNRTLEQELTALTRGVSLECLVCGEFVMKRSGTCFCPECSSLVGDEEAVQSALESTSQAG
jgi:Zn finger protein HypA/HybF involved in hydrogenase expression